MNKILVVPTEKYKIFSFYPNDSFEEFLNTNGLYLDRPYAETDPDFLQIIPYVVVHRNNKEIFAYTRLKKGNESRLHGNISVGIGGHVQKIEGVSPFQNYIDYINIELKEELDISNFNSLSLLAPNNPIYIYDTSNEVGKVHLGIVFTLDVGTEKVSINETDKIEGKFYSLEELFTLHDRYENWTKIALKGLYNI